MAIPNLIRDQFTLKFETEMDLIFRHRMAQLPKLLRYKSVSQNQSAAFLLYGTTTGGYKARGAEIPISTPTVDRVWLTPKDWHTADTIDTLDELKSSADEATALAESQAHAVADHCDRMVVKALDSATLPASNVIPATFPGESAESNMTAKKAMRIATILKENFAYEKGQTFVVVSSYQFESMLSLPEFASADYVGYSNPAWGTGELEGRRWMGLTWFESQYLSRDESTKDRKCYAWNKRAVGYAVNRPLTFKMSFENTRDAFFYQTSISDSAGVIQKPGVVRIICRET